MVIRNKPEQTGANCVHYKLPCVNDTRGRAVTCLKLAHTHTYRHVQTFDKYKHEVCAELNKSISQCTITDASYSCESVRLYTCQGLEAFQNVLKGHLHVTRRNLCV